MLQRSSTPSPSFLECLFKLPYIDLCKNEDSKGTEFPQAAAPSSKSRPFPGIGSRPTAHVQMETRCVVFRVTPVDPSARRPIFTEPGHSWGHQPLHHACGWPVGVFWSPGLPAWPGSWAACNEAGLLCRVLLGETLVILEVRTYPRDLRPHCYSRTEVW